MRLEVLIQFGYTSDFIQHRLIMNRMFYLNKPILLITFALLAIFILHACNKPKGYRTESGLIFYVYGDQSKDSTAKVGEVIKFNYKKYVNDSLVESTYPGIPQYEQVMPGLFYPYEAGEIYPYFRKGDSIVLYQEADSLLKRRLFYPVPSYVSSGDEVVTHFKVLDIFSSDSLAGVDMNEEYPRAMARNRKSGASRLKRYLDKRHIDAELTPDTVYIETIKEGQGVQVEPGDMITFRFTAKTITGSVFGTNTGEDDVPMDYEVMSGFMPKGIDETLPRLQVGDHVRMYVPAMKAFGASPPPGLEKGFQDIIFEVEILSKKSVEN